MRIDHWNTLRSLELISDSPADDLLLERLRAILEGGDASVTLTTMLELWERQQGKPSEAA